MKTTRSLVSFSVVATFCLSLLPMGTATAEETDFSCIEERVLAKIMVTQRYREFDIILNSDCPGSVNWTMCIEKMDPFTHKVTETLTPSGTIEPDKKFRINMQMKKQEDQRNKLNGYEEFYVNMVYDINSMLAPSCVARSCESEKRPLREQIRANHRSLQKAQAAVDKEIKTECPQTGWSNSQQERCQSKIEKDSQASMKVLKDKDRELKSELASINPELCEVH